MQFFTSNSTHEYQEEIPITSTPIFEGHLYIRTVKKQWKWRLFRFDGSCFTCLSSKSTKELPLTLQNSSSSTLLLMTPKDKDKRIIKDEVLESKYYQLPEWSVDINNISSISILKRSKSSNASSRCFSIRTFDSNQFVLKAQKQKDLERWLFVLTKMWKFTQAAQLHITQQQQLYHVYSHPSQIEQEIEEEEEEDLIEDNIPLAHSIIHHEPEVPIQNLSNEKIKVIEEWRKSLGELVAGDPTIQIAVPPPIEPIPEDDNLSIFTDMTSVSKRNQKPTPEPKSPKKLLPNINFSLKLNANKLKNSITPSSKEPPEDDKVYPIKKTQPNDVKGWMNSSKKNLNRLSKQPIDNNSSSSNINRKSMMIQPNFSAPDQADVNYGISPEMNPYGMNYFQDVYTSYDEPSYEPEHSNNMKYHTSVRGKKISKMSQGEILPVNEQQNINNEMLESDISKADSGKERKKSSLRSNGKTDGDLSKIGIKSITRRASLPLTNQIAQQQQQSQNIKDNTSLINQQKINMYGNSQPLTFSTSTGTSKNRDKKKKKEDKDENISLADLQKHLRSLNMNGKSRQRCPSDPSVQDLNTLRQQHQQQQPQQNIYFYQPSSIVTPINPPNQYHRPTSFYLPNEKHIY